MNRKINILICSLAMLLIGITIVNTIPNTLSANDDVPPGETATEVVFGVTANGFTQYTYAVTDEGNLFVCDHYHHGAFVPITETATNYGMPKGGQLLDQIETVSATAPEYTHNVMALRTDGSIYVWGNNQYGQFGDGTLDSGLVDIPRLIRPNVPGKIVDVQTTFNANFILMDNGDVYASGDGTHGLLGNGSTVSSSTFTKVNIDNVKKLAGEANTMFALKNDGSVYTWGKQIYDGKEWQNDVTEPKIIYKEDGTPFNNVVDISCESLPIGWTNQAGVSMITIENGMANAYQVGYLNVGGIGPAPHIHKIFSVPVTDSSDVKNAVHSYVAGDTMGMVVDGAFYTKEVTPFTTPATKVVKGWRMGSQFSVILSESGAIYVDGIIQDLDIGIKLSALKSNKDKYTSEEKYNDSLDVTVSTNNGNAITCTLENPVGSGAVTCPDFSSNEIHLSADENRIYQKYIFTDTVNTRNLIVDLYKAKPRLADYSSTAINKIKTTDSILIAVPNDQSSWNAYSATITDSTGTTSDFTGGTLAEDSYTIHLRDSYGNTQDYQFLVKDYPEPTLEFTPNSSTLTYGDNFTKVNNTIGTFTLKYPDGEPTSNIKTIQLGNSGDESHFSIDTSGALKVKGSNLDAGTYSVTATGTDGNAMPFTKTVSITVNKKDQNNYQITNSANYPLQVNQEINITTSGNESGENETYTITSGNTVAQIVGNKFKLLSSGTFTLQATVGGNTNYNSKTVTKQITVSQLPTQNPPVAITSKDSFVYGDTYTPTYSGGQGSGAVSWNIENDNGTGAVLNNGSVKVTGVGTFTLKVTKAGTSSYQESTDTKVITVNKRKTIVKPKDVTKTVGQAFKDNGATYTPQPISGDNLGTLTITSKYPDNQVPGRYTDGIQASGLSNPNYEFEYQEGTLIINSNALPNNGDGYYKVTGTKGKNNWYVSDVQISATGKNGYDEISRDGVNFQTSALVYSTDGDYPTEFYLRNSSTGLIAKAIRYQLKIDQTPPDVPTLSMKEINKNVFARFINALSFGSWMNQGVQVTMTSTDGTSGIDIYEYTETSQSGSSTKTSTNGIVTYNDDVEITLQAKACDKAGNCSSLSNSESIMIDTKAPTITGVKDKSEYKFYYLPRFVNVKDDYSGLSYSEYKLDGTTAGTIQNNVDERIDAVGEYEVYAIDNAGNEITISFKIVPLPDIEKEIDGSDESKDIIDQIKDELDEIKDKIDETEKKDIEDWIKDALDKWNSLRKKVVETDDKSAKIEGQGDTSFDPSVILIVDDITDQADTIPPLPRKAINIYDVYLQKGNVRIQPDGSIKVYLPYHVETNIGNAMGGAMDSLANPIVYQIDEKDKVTEISCKREGSFVTFVTDELLRYAISDDQQEINKDDTCVVGPDGSAGTGDEVCGLPSDDGKQPEKQPDGSVKVPEGGKVEFPDGKEIDTPDGAIIHPDGSVTLPDGTEYDPNGNKKPNKQCKLDGTKLNIDTNDDGYPDVNIDLDNDCIADLNVDMNGDNIPDINIDGNGDGKANINIDTDDDGKADLNILKITTWKPNKVVTINGITYDTMTGLKPYLNIDIDGDGEADYNIDTNGDGIPDKNLLDNNSNSNIKNSLGGANTGDNTKWIWWWILLIITTATMIYAQVKKRQTKRMKQKDTFQ